MAAGDSFLAALIHGIINEQTNEEILKFSNAVGAYVASKKGAIPELDIEAITSFKTLSFIFIIRVI